MIIDLTRPFDETTPVYPGDPKPEITAYSTIAKTGINERTLKFNTHFSTHIDAPYHMLADGKKLEEFALETFVGNLVVVDTDSDFTRNVSKGDVVFFKTNGKQGQIISEGAAQELIDLGVKIVGLDAMSFDSEPFPIPKLFFRNDVLIV